MQYFPDTLHYREADLQTWLPELKAMGVSWLSIEAPMNRAIPEHFIMGLVSAGIEPVLRFNIPLDMPFPPETLETLLRAYVRWGVHYICLFDKPNQYASWPSSGGIQADLVERFLDIFLPLADTIVRNGLYAIFPPLEPGGNYWDLAFLRSALQAMRRRGYSRVLGRLVVGAYAWGDAHPLEWGAGGPERWAGARPYFTPPGEQDQKGFRIFDWYQAIIQAVLGKSLPILFLGMGARTQNDSHLEKNLAIARLLRREAPPEGDDPLPEDTIPDEILGGCFHLLATAANNPYQPHAWFQSDEKKAPVVGELQTLNRVTTKKLSSVQSKSASLEAEVEGDYLINHYLLLPAYEWGVADWHLDVIRPFIKQHHPTVGFSIDEAHHAAKVTVIGGIRAFPETVLSQLRVAGSRVTRIDGDGMTIATKLAAM